jgi:N-acetylglucosaminyldiphosphoundecaprenol N-acetyl-beta-D-mannosaminyltransferase
VTNPRAAARVDILGVAVTATTMANALDVVSGWVTRRERSYATFADVHSIVQAQRSNAMLEAHRRAKLVACDGMPLVWLCRRAGAQNAERVYGPDFMLSMCSRAAQRGWAVFFLGGKPGVAERLATRLGATFPGLRIAGTLAPPFRELNRLEDDEVVATINASGADIVWVGLGCPKQELWMADHAGRVRASALLGVGAAFDFLSGTVRQAPRWMQRGGLEWLFRATTEPGRLGRRYVRNIPVFCAAVIARRPRLVNDTSDSLV